MEHLEECGEVLSTSWSDASCPVKHIRGVTLQRGHHQGHEVRILIVILVVSDTVSPLPKGIGYIIRMSLITTEFWNLDLTRKSILLFLPPSGGACIIGVTATSAFLTASTSTPLTKGPIMIGGITRCSIIRGGERMIERRTPSQGTRYQARCRTTS